MPAKKDLHDMIWNLAYSVITQSAANTATSERIDFNLSVNNNKAIEILLLNLYLIEGYSEIVADADVLTMALAAQATISTYAPTNRSIYDYNRIRGGSAEIGAHVSPITKKFEDSLGRGMLIAPDQVYCHVDSSGLVSAARVIFELKYRVVDIDERIAMSMLTQINKLSD